MMSYSLKKQDVIDAVLMQVQECDISKLCFVASHLFINGEQVEAPEDSKKTNDINSLNEDLKRIFERFRCRNYFSTR